MEKATVFFTQIPYKNRMYHARGVVDEARRLQEFTLEDLSNPSLVDRVYLAKVVDLVPSIGAAFVLLDGKQKGYLPFDCCDHALKVDEELPVQVTTDALKTKDAVVSQFFQLSSEHCVLIHGNGNHGVSKKLSRSERDRWKEFLSRYEGTPYHLLLRTNVQEVTEVEVEDEIRGLVNTYVGLLRRASISTCFALLYQKEVNYRGLLDTYKTRYQAVCEAGHLRVVTDLDEVYTAVQRALSPEESLELERYNDPGYELYKLYSLSTQIEELLDTKVWLKSGANILIESMETLTAIDVNSAKKRGKRLSDAQALEVNLEAADEIARQLRLRNISGMILIDFINMEEDSHKERLIRAMKHAVASDERRVVVVDITKLGLMELTREKSARTLKETIN